MSKLNKKGFTLVELLAVIAILAILMLLITPQILSLFTQGKENSFVLQVQSIYKTANEQYLSKQFSAGGAPTSFCHEAGKNTGISLNMNFDDIMSYKVEIDAASGNISSITAYDDTYIFESTASPVKITDIKASARKGSTTTITCPTTTD